MLIFSSSKIYSFFFFAMYERRQEKKDYSQTQKGVVSLSQEKK